MIIIIIDYYYYYIYIYIHILILFLFFCVLAFFRLVVESGGVEGGPSL